MEQKKTILIVDDEKDFRDILRDKLALEGFATLTAGDGEEGLRVALMKKPDLILLDIIMPQMDGLEMLEKLREDTWGKNANVIVLTVLDSPEQVSRAIKEGGYNYLVKTDWKIGDVIMRIKKELGTS